MKFNRQQKTNKITLTFGVYQSTFIKAIIMRTIIGIFEAVIAHVVPIHITVSVQAKCTVRSAHSQYPNETVQEKKTLANQPHLK